MPTVVPSQIVQYIDKTFSEDEERGAKHVVLSPPRSGCLNALLTLVDHVPNPVVRQNSMGLKAIDYSAGSLQTPTHDPGNAMAGNFDYRRS